MAKSKLSASERTSLTNQLNSYSGKKDKAVTAKNNLEADRTQLKGYIDSFEAEQKKLTDKYLEVKKTDVFEGKMANTLAEKISSASKAIDNGVTYSKNLYDAIDTQIKQLETQIQTWSTEISNLNTKLNSK